MPPYCKLLRIFRKNNVPWVTVSLNLTAHAKPITLSVEHFLSKHNDMLPFFPSVEANSLMSIGQNNFIPIIETQTTPKGTNLYSLLQILQVIILTAANCMSVKLIHVLNIDIVAGAMCFPLTYSISAIIVEIYGFNKARQTIIFSICGSALFSFLMSVSVELPSANTWLHQASYALLFQTSGQIFLASSTAFILGDILSSYFLALLKERTESIKLYTRVLLSSALGIVIDSVIFILIAHTNSMSHYAFGNMLINVLFHKFLYEAIASVIVYFAVNHIRKHYPNLCYSPLNVRYIPK